MTKSECYSQISICNAGIEEDQKKIREWEEKINLYENTNRRLERGQENMADFCSCHSRKIRQTRDYFPQVKYVEGYVQDMTEYLQGAEYNSVNGKFDGAIATINRKKQEAISEIEKLNEDIPRVKFLEEVFKTRGMHEFKKVEFAQMVKKNIKHEEDISPEVVEIIDEIRLSTKDRLENNRN